MLKSKAGVGKMGDQDIKNSITFSSVLFVIIKVDVLTSMPRKTEENQGDFSALIITLLL